MCFMHMNHINSSNNYTLIVWARKRRGDKFPEVLCSPMTTIKACNYVSPSF